ncbi:MAG: P-loop NTPase fold protein [Elusimicrobiota bacterium]
MIADTAAEMIVQANGQPLSLGVSGSWGVGKSSMIKLIQKSLQAREDGKFIFVDFNAWLYQGYDDARAALMDVIARKLVKHAEENKTSVDKAKDLLKRVAWLRLAKLGASGVAMAHGIPPVWLAGDIAGFFEHLTAEGVASATEAGKQIVEGAKTVIKAKPTPDSPPKEIQELRDHFEETLRELGVSVVVFVDDLDRCLPATAISTLEAIRLFLFLRNAAFVIAADDKMIRHAVRVHFGDIDRDRIDDELVTNYFDKLIQVPLRVPPLGTQDVRAYMMMLYIENSGLDQGVRDSLRKAICKQLGESWQGKRVDSNFVIPLIRDCPKPLIEQLHTADRLAPFMASAKQISGNPRLIKRFLNTLSIRLSIARNQNVTVDETVLAKMLLFERCGGEKPYAALIAKINEDPEGKPRFLKPYEEKVAAGAALENVPPEWSQDFTAKWLAMSPLLADRDLRPAVHVSREHLPIITAADSLSPEAAELVTGLLKMTQPNKIFKDRLGKLSKPEAGLVMERLLVEAKQVQEWSQPAILWACMAVADAVPEQGERLADFLHTVPVTQLKPAIVPTIREAAWAAPVLKRWSESANTPGPVKKAIEKPGKGSR